MRCYMILIAHVTLDKNHHTTCHVYILCVYVCVTHKNSAILCAKSIRSMTCIMMKKNEPTIPKPKDTINDERSNGLGKKGRR